MHWPCIGGLVDSAGVRLRLQTLEAREGLYVYYSRSEAWAFDACLLL